MLTTLAQQFNAGGTFMWVIGAVLALSAAVIAERLVFYFLICRGSNQRAVERAIQDLEAGHGETLAKRLARRSAPFYAFLHGAVERFRAGQSAAEIEKGIQKAAVNELPRLTKRLNYLSLFANIATLLGLIGTISGLQASFSSLATVEASKKSALLAAGIAEAMTCTGFGLIVAVPCMILYTVLHNKQQQLTKNLDLAMGRFLEYVSQKQGA